MLGQQLVRVPFYSMSSMSATQGETSVSIFMAAQMFKRQVMVWDDQSIMDGWGSYPDWLQTTPVFQVSVWSAMKKGLNRLARKQPR